VKLLYTAPARADLDAILRHIAATYPAAHDGFIQRLKVIEQRIAQWPRSAHAVEQRKEVRIVPMIRYPYKIFYEIVDGAVHIVHVRHAARAEPG